MAIYRYFLTSAELSLIMTLIRALWFQEWYEKVEKTIRHSLFLTSYKSFN